MVIEGSGLTVTIVICGALEGHPGAIAINVYSTSIILLVGLINKSAITPPSGKVAPTNEVPVTDPALIPVISIKPPAIGVLRTILVRLPEHISSVGEGFVIVNVGSGLMVTIVNFDTGSVQPAAAMVNS